MKPLTTSASLLLLAVAYGLNSDTVTSKGTVWKPVKVYTFLLKDFHHAVERTSAGSVAMCAGLATKTFPSGFFCYNDGRCDLHDHQVQKYIDECLDDSPTSLCYTLEPPQPEFPSFVVLEGLEDLGPLLEVTSAKTWLDARSFCHCRGSELFTAPTPGAFRRLAAHYLENSRITDVWVGVKSRRWLDGRYVDNSEWSYNEPNEHYENCARMTNMKGTDYRLADFDCYKQYPSLCQK
ncbi:C-type lectin lectoxin-Phi2-like [Homarus americanus]|uniref:C-type lectin lectoxin-Phi2-like n=1 Tax=Homarus americanus TaxID=6706 RepID=A0A8J5N8I6_HOMAM|nr:C-type lectin lectoxin-Phi2-like [Homarus americanus]